MKSMDNSLSKAEKSKLGLTEELFKRIVENVNDLIGILNKDFKYEYLNEEIFLKVLGYSSEDLLGKSALGFIHPEDVNLAVQTLKEGFKKGEGSAEVRFKHKDGNWVWIEARGKIFLDNDGKMKALIVSRDVSQRKRSEMELKDSEERYRLITENVNDLIAILNDKFEYEYINEKIHQKLRGSSNKDRIGMKALDLVHPDDLGSVREIFNKAFEIGEGVMEVRLRNKDGTYDWFEVKGKTFIDIDGKNKILLISRNITARLKAAEKIQESEEKFRSIAEQSSLGIVILQDGLIKYANKAIRDITGYLIEEIEEWTQNEFMKKIHPEDLPLVKEHIQMKLKGQTDITSHYSFRIITKSNNVKWVDLHSKAINFQGKIAILATFIDITDKVRAEQHLKESEEKFRLAFERAGDAIFWANPKTRRIINCNSAAETLLEMKKEEIIGFHHSKLYPPQESKYMDKILGNFSKNEGIFETDSEVLNKSGKIIPVHITATYYPIGEQVIVHGTFHNLTERKITENALKVSEQKYREAFDRANFYKDLFAHDINNILQIINSSAELITLNLRDNEESREIESIANIMKRQVQRGSKLVNNVQTLSELEESQLSINPIDVCEYLENSIEFIRKAYPERTLDIEVIQSCEEVIVKANEYLQEVFENILINAIKYNENHSVEVKINISTYIQDGNNYYKLEFIDNGIGVADERKKLIFERGKRELKGTKGMGLGLSLVKNILDNYDGKIWVEDRAKGDYTQGSKFIILLPILK
ncbi:MAG: PAS domain S-box protein [Candidatus Hodarchaeota archaeon]